MALPRVTLDSPIHAPVPARYLAKIMGSIFCPAQALIVGLNSVQINRTLKN